MVLAKIDRVIRTILHNSPPELLKAHIENALDAIIEREEQKTILAELHVKLDKEETTLRNLEAYSKMKCLHLVVQRYNTANEKTIAWCEVCGKDIPA